MGRAVVKAERVFEMGTESRVAREDAYLRL
jgi:hypothetical protein